MPAPDQLWHGHPHEVFEHITLTASFLTLTLYDSIDPISITYYIRLVSLEGYFSFEPAACTWFLSHTHTLDKIS